MKRPILSGLAISMLAASSLPGFAAPIAVPSVPDSNVISAQYREPVRKERRVVNERVIVKKKVVTKQVVKQRWKNGQRYESWRSAKGMKDYSRYDWTSFDPEHKKKRHDEVFPLDCEKAYRLGSELLK